MSTVSLYIEQPSYTSAFQKGIYEPETIKSFDVSYCFVYIRDALSKYKTINFFCKSVQDITPNKIFFAEPNSTVSTKPSLLNYMNKMIAYYYYKLLLNY